MKEHKEIDEFSGVETTGHEWDGLKELNNPLPRWWLWTFYATVIWAVGYWVLMPSWPLVTDYTRGLLGHSDRANVAERLAELQALRAQHGAGVADAELQEIIATSELLEFAMASGRAAFGDNCAPCHGAGGAGAPGYPNLNDDNWLWGGTLDDIHHAIAYGIRSEHPQAHIGDMPAFGQDGLLNSIEIWAVANHVRTMSGLEAEETADLELGRDIYADFCAACHGASGEGDRSVGAPNLANNLWLFGGDIGSVVATIRDGRASVMPAWADRLDEVAVKSLTVYVHSLGGGE
jgi:cytochrome c oxidase cbb3-type subunit III